MTDLSIAEEIADDVRKRLRRNVLVDDGLIQVSVENDAVTLSGTVGSRVQPRATWIATPAA